MNGTSSQQLLISVIIPLYNKAPYIKRALDSVLMQTVQNFEVIVVNDGSTDGGDKIVEGYGDARIHLINQENQGVSAARNHWVNEARAELVEFLDADDEWLPNFLETVLKLRDKYPDIGMYTTGYKLIEGNKETPCTYLSEKGTRLLESYYYNRLDAGVHNQFIMMSAVVVDKQTFQGIGGFNPLLSYAEDINLYERMAVVTKIAYTPEIAAKYNYDIPDNTRTHVVFRKPLTSERMETLWNTIQNTIDESKEYKVHSPHSRRDDFEYLPKKDTSEANAVALQIVIVQILLVPYH